MLFNQLSVLGAATTPIGIAIEKLWNDKIYTVIKEVGGTLAIATFVCAAFYFFILGRSKSSLDTAKQVMVGSGIGIVVIYIAPTVIAAVIEAMGAFNA